MTMKHREIQKKAQHAAILSTRDAAICGLVETVTGAVITTRKSKIEAAHICGYLSAMADVYIVMRGTCGDDGEDGVLQMLDMIIETYKNRVAANN